MNIAVSFQDGPLAGQTKIVPDVHVGSDIELDTFELSDIPEDVHGVIPTGKITYTVIQRVGQAAIARKAWA